MTCHCEAKGYHTLGGLPWHLELRSIVYAIQVKLTFHHLTYFTVTMLKLFTNYCHILVVSCNLVTTLPTFYHNNLIQCARMMLQLSWQTTQACIPLFPTSLSHMSWVVLLTLPCSV
jgi:hypothetical protein